MLDFIPMSYWRKLIIVVLLALSLPVQSLAAISMQCAPAELDGAGAPLGHTEHGMTDHLHEMSGLAFADDGGRRHHGNSHQAHPCSTCASCCVGTALPAAPTVAASPDATRIIARIPPSARAVSFLTDGIERPPRYTLL